MNAHPDVAIIGGGPAGLFAAEKLAGSGFSVTIYEKMPSVGRKFLMAGLSGLNLTHSEPMERFVARYPASAEWLSPMLEAFPPASLRTWAEGLGQETFIGSSGRVFPKSMKASPLLRAWLARLDSLGVQRELRHEWRGVSEDGALILGGPEGETRIRPRATLLALGGASWPRLGSDGSWAGLLAKSGVTLEPFAPSNCGVEIKWSARMPAHSFGQPLKGIRLTCAGSEARGEAVLTRSGLEGGAIYALSAALRTALAGEAPVTLTCDLRPDIAQAELARRLDAARASDSLANRLRKGAGLSGAALAMLFELRARQSAPPSTGGELAVLIKALPVPVVGLSPINRAISTAGGIAREALDEGLMLRNLPGVFAAGEMLAWDAPTGGYLLQACFATANHAADGIADYLG